MGIARLAGRVMPAISGLATGVVSGGLAGGMLTAGLTQGGSELGSRLFVKHLADNDLIAKLNQRSNANRQMAYDRMPDPTPAQMSTPGYMPRDPFVPRTNADFAGEVGGYVGGGLGLLGGLGGTAILGSIFNRDEPEPIYVQQPIAVAAPPQPMPQGQAPPQGTVPQLNAEQVKKAQQRALEQAALNEYYAQQLLQYPVQ